MGEVAYLRFASVYRSFESADDFEAKDVRGGFYNSEVAAPMPVGKPGLGCPTYFP